VFLLLGHDSFTTRYFLQLWPRRPPLLPSPGPGRTRPRRYRRLAYVYVTHALGKKITKLNEIIYVVWRVRLRTRASAGTTSFFVCDLSRSPRTVDDTRRRRQTCFSSEIRHFFATTARARVTCKRHTRSSTTRQQVPFRTTNV